MSHHDEHVNVSPEEAKFNEYILRGDDLSNIHQYTPAKENYLKAFELHFNDSKANEKLQTINDLQKYEQKTIIKILLVAVVIIVVAWLFKNQY
jgi:hypothetical protein